MYCVPFSIEIVTFLLALLALLLGVQFDIIDFDKTTMKTEDVIMKSNSIDTPETASSYLVLLLGLLRAHNWKSIRKTFFSSPQAEEKFQNLAAEVEELSSSWNGMTILHICAGFYPPALLMNKMVKLCPTYLWAKDNSGRTPLHAAADAGASPATLKVLIDSYPDPCEIQDKDGKTPLHLACANAHSYKAIATILKGSPKATIMEDNDGMNAIECALTLNPGTDIKTLQLLQVVAIKVLERGSSKGRKDKCRRASPRMLWDSYKKISQASSFFKRSQKVIPNSLLK
mmetsp:Transcript_20985/g.44296  ORF Transcript_20985/g.44296 Transcript_20985/m.44296 type:complete len:286 (+) Transcript_20985:209-1066(+)